VPRVRFLGYLAGGGLVLFDKEPTRVGLEHRFLIRDLVSGRDEEVGGSLRMRS
jgi:hypothetical protein